MTSSTPDSTKILPVEKLNPPGGDAAPNGGPTDSNGAPEGEGIVEKSKSAGQLDESCHVDQADVPPSQEGSEETGKDGKDGFED